MFMRGGKNMKILYAILLSLLSIINIKMIEVIAVDSLVIDIAIGEEFESSSEHKIFKYTNNNDKEFLFYVKHDLADSKIVEIYNDNNESLIYTGGEYSSKDDWSIRNFTLNVGETAYIKFNQENIKAVVWPEEVQIKATIDGQVMSKMLIQLNRGHMYKLGFVIYDETLDEFVEYTGEIAMLYVSQNVYPSTGNLVIIPEDALIGYHACFRVKSIFFNIEVK